MRGRFYAIFKSNKRFRVQKIFGDENRKHILISFLNSVLRLPLDAQITEVVLLNPSQAPHLPGAKETILDVRCQDQKGAKYIVEMQVLPQSYFDKRVLHYVSRSYAHQLDSGMNYNLLKPVVFLGILNFSFTESRHYLSTHCIQDIDRKEGGVLNDFQFTFAELPKFDRSEEELVTIEEKWLYFLKYADQLDAIPSVIHEAAVREAFEIVNRLNWSDTALESYEQRGIEIQDQMQRVHFGYEKGLQEGEIKGRQEEREEVALRLLETGVLPMNEIARITGLSELALKVLSKKS